MRSRAPLAVVPRPLCSLALSLPVLCGLFALPAQAPAPIPEGIDAKAWRSAEKRIERFRFDRDRLKVRLFANRQQVQDPAAICFDDRNRLYVAETMRWRRGVDDNRQRLFWFLDDIRSQTVADRLRMYQKWQERFPMSYYTKYSERVVRLDDLDGDGMADRRTIYAADFDDPLDGPAIGLLARGDKVWLTCIPHLWELTDTDGDGVADRRRSIQGGFGVRVSLSGHDMHGLCFGPDGRLYWSIGDRGYNIETREGRRFAAPASGAVFRCEPDGSRVEVFHTGLRNPQELAFDQFGNLFTVDNNADLGDKARVVYVMEGGHTGWHSGFQNLTTFRKAAGIGERDNLVPWMVEKLWHTDHEGRPAYVLPPLPGFEIDGSVKVSGPSGLVFHSTGALGEELANGFYVCDFRGRAEPSGVFTFRVESDGAGFRVAGHREFLGGIATPDIDVSYDGKLYIADWAGSWTGNEQGNVYTVEDPAGRQQGYVKSALEAFRSGFGKQETGRLAELLAHPDLRVRHRAQFALAERGDAGHAALLQAARSHQDLLARLHGIWGVGQLGRVDPARVAPLVELCRDPEPEVRGNAIRAIGESGHRQAAPALLPHLGDTSPRVRAFAAIALGKLGCRDALAPLCELLAANADRDKFLRHAAVFALETLGDRSFVHRQLQHANRGVRLAMLLVLRRWRDPKIADLLSDRDPALVEAAVRAIHDESIPAEPQLAGSLLALSDAHSPLTHQRAINASFRLGGVVHAAVLLEYVRRAGAKHQQTKVEALHLLGVWDRPPQVDRVLGLVRPYPDGEREDITALVRARLPRILAGATGTLAAKAIELAERYRVDLDPEVLVGVVCNQGMQTDFRVASLGSLATHHPDRLSGRLDTLLGDRQPEVRAAALGIALRLVPEQGRAARLAFLRSDDVAQRRIAYAHLDPDPGAEVVGVLVARLRELGAGKGQPATRLELVEAAAKCKDPAVVAANETYLESRGTGVLAPYAESLHGGDRARGKELFQTHGIAQCVRCHRLDQKPSTGPGLRGVGARDRQYLLRSLITPSSEIAEGFGTVLIETRGGEELLGVVTQEDATTVTLKGEKKTHRIAVADIASRSKPISAMVPMAGILTPREVRDLIEFLSSLKR